MGKGKITQIVGPVIDVEFSKEELPPIYNALKIENNGNPIILEVAQYLGDGVVRAISMSSTDGLSRGMEVIDTLSPITVPVGEKTLGRIYNVLGDPIDNLGEIKTEKTG